MDTCFVLCFSAFYISYQHFLQFDQLPLSCITSLYIFSHCIQPLHVILDNVLNQLMTCLHTQPHPSPLTTRTRGPGDEANLLYCSNVLT